MAFSQRAPAQSSGGHRHFLKFSGGDRGGQNRGGPETWKLPRRGDVIKGDLACRPALSLLLVGFWSQLVVCQGHLGFLLQDTGTVYPKAGSSLFYPPS